MEWWRKDRLELSRMHAHWRAGQKTNPAPGAVRSVDVAHSRLARIDLLRSSVQAAISRSRVAGGPGNARGRKRFEPANHGTGAGPEQPHDPRRRDCAIEKRRSASCAHGQAT